ncbi:MAG: hypothetical protein GY781_01545 [Gammaproteobacteria bacterium]|nr:hypothetical protein [Gammaproteobacteria bacterium]
MTFSLLLATVERALKYHVTTMDGLLRISSQLLNNDLCSLPEIYLEDGDYQQRDTYQQGRFSQEAETQEIIDENRQEEEEEEEEEGFTDG